MAALMAKKKYFVTIILVASFVRYVTLHRCSLEIDFYTFSFYCWTNFDVNVEDCILQRGNTETVNTWTNTKQYLADGHTRLNVDDTQLNCIEFSSIANYLGQTRAINRILLTTLYCTIRYGRRWIHCTFIWFKKLYIFNTYLNEFLFWLLWFWLFFWNIVWTFDEKIIWTFKQYICCLKQLFGRFLWNIPRRRLVTVLLKRSSS